MKGRNSRKPKGKTSSLAMIEESASKVTGMPSSVSFSVRRSGSLSKRHTSTQRSMKVSLKSTLPMSSCMCSTRSASSRSA